MLDELALFVSIVEMGSLRAAAEKAAIPPSTLTRRWNNIWVAACCTAVHDA
ncbi:TPA: LysR family transcriptional regulator [Yersinia enterocolitica]